MSIIAFTAAGGSPGVSTTTVGLGLCWPRPVVLVEADPTGGSGILAGYFQGQVAHDGGLIELAMAQREDLVAAELPHQLLDLEGSQARLLPGSRCHAQAGTLTTLWPVLLDALRDLDATGQDVLVDAGRLGLEGSPTPLLYGADLTVLLTRSTLPAVIAATSWAETLRDQTEATATRVGVVVVGERHPYSAREVADALGLPLVGTLPWDRRTAAVLSRARGGFGRRAPLRPGLVALGEALRTHAAAGVGRPVSPLAWLARSVPQSLGGAR